jgi:glutamine---fructose-6-phosphate transaminase (isomerizing)
MSYLDNIWEQPSIISAISQRYRQPAAWQNFQHYLERHPQSLIILTGMGGSYQALWAVWQALNQQGLPAILVEAGELFHYMTAMVSQSTLLVVVSQSGESIEIRRLIELLPREVAIVSITNTDANYLARQSRFNFPTFAGQEVGVATKTFTSSLALLQLLGCLLLKMPLEPVCEQLDQIAAQMQQVLLQSETWRQTTFAHLSGAQHLALIGRGPGMAATMNGALILQEAARIPAMSYSGGQFRHGPMELVSEQLGVIILANDGVTSALNLKLAREIASRTGKVVLMEQTQLTSVSHGYSPNLLVLELPGCPEFLSPLLAVLPLQLLGAEFAQKLGIVPGEFRWSGKVILVE